MIPLKLDIVSDVVCPWCVIGYLEWQRVLLDAPDFDVNIHWQPFELNPHMAASGENFQEHVQRKYGGGDRISEAGQVLRKRAAELGFDMRLDNDLTIHNTFRAHQLMMWVEGDERQTGLQMALFKAHFIDHRNINDVDELVNIGTSVGLDEADVREVLSSARYAPAVRAREGFWLEQNVAGVPHMVVNDRFVLSGAPDQARLVRMLQLLRDEAGESQG